MPLGTLDRTPPPFFKQGPSALSKLMVCSALALFLMVADARFRITQPVRSAVATVLFPLQWFVMQPVLGFRLVSDYVTTLESAVSSEEAARRKLILQSQRANQVEQLSAENKQLRQLLGLRDRLGAPATAAEVLYDAADPYTRKVIIDKGLAQGVQPGSPVIDESGVLGQITRVHPLISEVTLVTDPDQAIPVLNTRTGVRGITYGDAGRHGSGGLELRYMAANADVQQGDLLTTSGVDGVYPPGIPVAKVARVERRPDSAFARIVLHPQALVDGARHVMVLTPMLSQIPPRPAPEDAAPVAKRPGVARK
ncbi:rod shape-determining protein MreC [Ramlibacter pallidus]|uniref:Cell shape-determining protein MreC n=1 Tax=Ramlibacter pallidus TaxID=2780087 RepID=A0ABR9S0K0_9BURK|nr:rod shape-determining protein MreC [Ramlibacter pallidus]MBE7367044.1 rod shape-determining protein MreC [Ramlibacter pallidus]